MLVLLIAVLFGVGSAIVASRRGSSPVGWFFIGLLLGPFGLGFSFMSGSRKKCPQCAESVRPEAIKCRYCGSELSPQVVQTVVVDAPLSIRQKVTIAAGLAILFALVFVANMR